jgi:hypothetical protein
MSLTTLDPVAPPGPDAGDAEPPAHYTCCDEKLAMCGTALAGGTVVDDDDPSPDCELCVYVWEEGLPCPAPACPAGGAP